VISTKVCTYSEELRGPRRLDLGTACSETLLSSGDWFEVHIDAAMASAVMKSGLSSPSGTPRWVLPVKHLLWGFAWLCTAFYAFVWISGPDERVGYKFYDKMYHAFEKNKQWGGPGKLAVPIDVVSSENLMYMLSRN